MHESPPSEAPPTMADMSVVPHPPEPPDEPEHLTILPAGEAIRQARPLPSDDDMAIEGLTDEEWTAFAEALAER